jgi:hypothetical protein
MGRFPAKLFLGVGSNGQLKNNWATFFLKLIAIAKLMFTEGKLVTLK